METLLLFEALTTCLRIYKLNIPSTHTTLFWRPYDVILALWTLYRHQNDVVCLLGWVLNFLAVLDIRFFKNVLLDFNANINPFRASASFISEKKSTQIFKVTKMFYTWKICEVILQSRRPVYLSLWSGNHQA